MGKGEGLRLGKGEGLRVVGKGGRVNGGKRGRVLGEKKREGGRMGKGEGSINYNTKYCFTTCSDFKGLQINTLPIYYQNLLKSWSNFLLLQTPMTKLEVLEQPLYGNSNIVFNGKPIFNIDIGPICQNKWNIYFNKKLPWRKIWTNLRINRATRKANQLSWKIRHNTVNTEAKLQKKWGNL